MALSRSDYLQILRHLQRTLRESDPQAFEVVGRSFERILDPREATLHYIDIMVKVMAEHSRGQSGRILSLLNRYIKTESGGPIQALRIELAPEEAELYEQESFDLARLQDHRLFISELLSLRESLSQDDDFEEEIEYESD